jgi:uncharacterized protein
LRSKLIMFLFLIFLIYSVDAVDYPSPNGYVNDFANMIDPDYEARLNREIMAIEETTTVEVVVVTVYSLEGISIEEYAVELFEKWGVGKKSNDNGLLILVAKNEREYRIETGYGLEGTINAARAGRIGREIIEPNFKNEEYSKGLYEAVQEIRGLIEQDPSVIARYERENYVYIDKKARNLVLFLIFISLIIFIKFIKDARQSWIFLLVFDTILLIGTYLYSEGLFVITAFILFFELLAVAINPINFMRSVGGFRGIFKDIILSSILGGILGGILGDTFKGRFKGRFGGGRSGGGGSSGKW